MSGSRNTHTHKKKKRCNVSSLIPIINIIWSTLVWKWQWVALPPHSSWALVRFRTSGFSGFLPPLKSMPVGGLAKIKFPCSPCASALSFRNSPSPKPCFLKLSLVCECVLLFPATDWHSVQAALPCALSLQGQAPGSLWPKSSSLRGERVCEWVCVCGAVQQTGTPFSVSSHTELRHSTPLVSH